MMIKKDFVYFCVFVFLMFISKESYGTQLVKKCRASEFGLDTLISQKKLKEDYKHLEGTYSLFVDGKMFEMKIKVKCNEPKAIIKYKGTKISSKFSYKKNIITISIDEDNTYMKFIGKIVNSAGAMEGIAYDNYGNKSKWTAAKLISENRTKTKSAKN